MGKNTILGQIWGNLGKNNCFACRGEAVICPEYERFNDYSTFVLPEAEEKEDGNIEV